MPDRNDCPTRGLCTMLKLYLGCGSDVCPWITPRIVLTPEQARRARELGFTNVIESPLPKERDD